jgi:hypothetical protein
MTANLARKRTTTMQHKSSSIEPAIEPEGVFGALFVVFLLGAVVFSATDNVAGQPEEWGDFTTVQIFVDSGDSPLAAYQLIFKDMCRSVRIVGIEGGEHAAFKTPPYYDAKAMQQDRVILAAFNTGDALPTGKTRVAVVHLQKKIGAEPDYRFELQAAASVNGKEIPVKIQVQERDDR